MKSADRPAFIEPLDAISTSGVVLGDRIEFVRLQERHECLAGDFGVLRNNVDVLAFRFPVVQDFIVRFELFVQVFDVGRTADDKIAITFAQEIQQF